MISDPVKYYSAIISPDKLYRYELRRIWDDNKPPLVLGMLNPSIADAYINDPTITRGVKRARRLGCGSLIVWNLGAGRATDPSDWLAMKDPIGPDNNVHIRRILAECKVRNGIAVVGWGNFGERFNRDLTAISIANEIGIKFHCLGTTKSGQPRHPLYVADNQPLLDWPRNQ